LTEDRLVEARALMHELTGMQLSVKTAEELIVPTIRTIENELFPGSAAIQTKSRIYEQMRTLIEELHVEERPDSETEAPAVGSEPQPGVAIVPFVGEGDELVGNILMRLLMAEGISSTSLSWRALRAEKLQKLQEIDPICVVISAIEARSTSAVVKWSRSTQQLLPGAVIVIGLWSLPQEGAARLIRRIKESQNCSVYTNLDQAVQGIAAFRAPARHQAKSD
jgi:hypothetical protein